jgi:hypothetical protein
MASPKASRRGDDPETDPGFSLIPPSNPQHHEDDEGPSAPSRFVTIHGHPLDEVVSALQKAIRRGRAQEALYWGHEMYKTFPAYFWRRMIVIASEDCTADPMIPVAIGQLAWSAWYASKEFAQRRSTEVVEIQAILMLARAPKSRETSDAYGVITRAKHSGFRLKVPDIALDKHTQRGKQKKRGLDHFESDGRLTAGPPAPTNEFEVKMWKRRARPVPDGEGPEGDVQLPDVDDWNKHPV